MTIAVIIPALDEAAGIAGAVESAAAPGVDVVVVDGGSSDDTCERARAAGARVLASATGRGRQLQTGVESTKAEVLVFLHADTRLAPDWSEAVLEALASPDVVGGFFRLRFEGGGVSLRALEWGVRVRVALFGLPYGDQAIFARRSVLERVGGVPDVPVMEDLDLVRALKKMGPLVSLSEAAATSPRRYREKGVLRTVLRHSLAVGAWLAGVDRRRVAGWLRG